MSKIVTDRWNFLHTESMGYAYLLSLSSKGGADMVHTDRLDTIDQLKNYFKVYFTSEDEQNQATEELERFLAKFVLESSPNGAEVNPLTYWSVYGRTEYPALARIALRVFSCPTSSADSERAWSVFDLIHSKRRNRLVNLRVNKLVFVYMNRAFRGDSENTMFHFE